MRAGLVAANETAPNPLDGYPKGSTVICAHCFVPLYVLERGIYPGDKVGRSIDAYAPISVSQLNQLRRDVPSVQAALKTWTDEEVREHCERILRPYTGMPAACPACQRSFMQVFAPDSSEVIDHAYTWRLVTIPPMSEAYPVRSSRVDI